MSENLFHTKLRAIVRQSTREAMKAQKAAGPKIVWKGKLRELGEFVLTLYNRKLIQATSETDALRQACEHFVRPSGGHIDPRALLQNTRNARDKRAGRL